MRKILLLFLFAIYTFSIAAQQHDNIWLLGYHGGSQSPDNDYFGISILDFSSGDLEIYDNQIIEMDFNITNISYCDEEGNLQYYSNGVEIEDISFNTMFDGEDFNDYTDDFQILPQGVLALPFPDHENKSIFFHEEKGYIPIPGWYLEVVGLYYFVIDMELNDGLGEVVLRKEPLLIDTLEYGKLTACKHANGRDWWMVINESHTNRFYKILLNPEGLNIQDNQIVGDSIFPGLGQAVFSPNGEIYVVFNSIDAQTGQFVEIYDFDRCNGLLSNHRKFNLDNNVSGGVAISPNSRYLYVSSYEYIYQYDLWASDIEESQVIVAIYDGFESPFGSRFFMAQLAPDGKIYLNCPNGENVLHVIHNPDEPGLACNVEQHGIQLPTPNSFSLPNFPNYRLGALAGSACDTIVTDVQELNPVVSEFSLFPNPSQGVVNFDFKEILVEETEFRFFDLRGKLVKTVSVPAHSKQYTCKVEDLANGVYFCKIGFGDFVVKLVVMR